jgi:hypothetical protein
MTITEYYLWLTKRQNWSHEDAVNECARSMRYRIPGDAERILELEEKCLNAQEPPPIRKLVRDMTHGVVNVPSPYRVIEEPWYAAYE